MHNCLLYWKTGVSEMCIAHYSTSWKCKAQTSFINFLFFFNYDFRHNVCNALPFISLASSFFRTYNSVFESKGAPIKCLKNDSV